MGEHPSIQKADWRTQAITTLTKEWVSVTGKKYSTGTPVALISTIKLVSKTLNFQLPNATALFLDFSYKLWKEAQVVLEKEKILDIKEYEDYDEIYNLVEKRMASIVFAYCALESFANECIPDDYIFENSRDDGKCIEKYNKEQMEKYVSLDTKLSEILPKIKKVKSPMGGPLWNKYDDLKKIRNRIIHMKTTDRKSVGPEEESIWRDLLDKDKSNFSLEAKEIIGYFFSAEPAIPRWFRGFPY